MSFAGDRPRLYFNVISTTAAIRIRSHGGPDLLQWEEVELAPVAAGEVRVRHTAIGVNYSDVNVRRGGFYLAHRPAFPLTLGNEASGVVQEVGPGVDDMKVGDRVCYAGMHGEFYEQTGAYAEVRNVPADRLLKIPDDITDQQAAALLLKGLTASMIINRLFRPRPGDAVLLHAAASGVGLILCQWARCLGATVIGTVGLPDKARIAREHGCDHTVLYREEEFVEATRRLVPAGVSAVFDGVGKDTFIRSLDCVRPFGLMINYGNASGHVPPFDLLWLARKSISVCRPGVGSYTRDIRTMRQAGAELFDLLRTGVLRTRFATYPLRDAAAAHRDLEGRRVSGSILLLP